MLKRDFEKQFNLRCGFAMEREENEKGLTRMQRDWSLRKRHWDAFMKKMHGNQSITDKQFETWEPSKEIIEGLRRSAS